MKATYLFFKASKLWGLTNFLFNGHDSILPEVKAAEWTLVAHYLVPRLRMGGATPPFRRTPSRHAERQLDLNFHV